ncbi:hypothetical protein [Streptomyces sp. NPDC093808]|uniref:hypothetical protein n=1 Tax=Streptomyces sp. NPDC093808 TaxID=3154985 RepID=UPI0034507B7D
MDGIAPTFADAEDLLDQFRVLNLALGEDAPLKAVDWARMLLAAERSSLSAPLLARASMLAALCACIWDVLSLSGRCHREKAHPDLVNRPMTYIRE